MQYCPKHAAALTADDRHEYAAECCDAIRDRCRRNGCEICERVDARVEAQQRAAAARRDQERQERQERERLARERAGMNYRPTRGALLPDESLRELLRRYRDGVSVDALAQSFLISTPSVRRLAAAARVLRVGGTSRSLTDVEKRVVNLVRRGRTDDQIVDELGVDPDNLADFRGRLIRDNRIPVTA